MVITGFAELGPPWRPGILWILEMHMADLLRQNQRRGMWVIVPLITTKMRTKGSAADVGFKIIDEGNTFALRELL